MSFDPSACERSGTENRSWTIPSPKLAASPIWVFLRTGEAVDRPVALLQILGSWGLGLRKAHEILTRLVDGETLPILLPNAPEARVVIETLKEFGIAVDAAERTGTIGAKAKLSEFERPQ